MFFLANDFLSKRKKKHAFAMVYHHLESVSFFSFFSPKAPAIPMIGLGKVEITEY